jgi:polysaccharide pyruvyl transferase WcaK-like protein
MGDDAMFSCLIKGIKDSDKNSKITFLARHPNKSFDQLYDVQSIQNLDHASNDEALGRMFLGFNAGDDRENLRQIKNALVETDLMIIGGNSLMEISENTFLRGVSSYATTLAMLTLFMGKQYALFGLNIVASLRSSYVKKQAKFLIENAAITTVREDDALRYLQDANVDTSRAHVTGDPAYGVDLAQVDNYSGYDILKREGIMLDPKKRTISFCLREEYWKSDPNSFKNLQKETCAIIRHILVEDNNQIIFIPNCNYEKGHLLEDDRIINRGIKERFGNDPRVHYVGQKLNLYETLALFKLTDIHISNRRHSNIFAALFAKPFIAIDTQKRTHITSFVQDLKQTEYLVKDQKFSTGVIKNFKKIITNYGSIAKKLSDVVKKRMISGLQPVTKILTTTRTYF